MVSSVTQPGLEKVAEAAPDACAFFRLYVRHDHFVEDQVSARSPVDIRVLA